MRLKFTKKNLISIFALVLLFTMINMDAMATDGYFSNGQGTRNKGMAGAGISFLRSPFSGSINPGALAFLDKKWGIEVSVGMFNPNRQYNVIGAATTPNNWGYFDGEGNFVADPRYSAFGLAEGTVESGSNIFIIPAIAFTYKLDDNSALGFNFFGNGGMNTDYDAKTYHSSILDAFGNPMPDGNPNPMANVTAPTGVNLQQMFMALSYARKFGNHSIGISPIFAYQTVEVNGMQAFRDMGSAGMQGMAVNRSGRVTNNGVSTSTGFGFRIGYQGEIIPGLRLGASYQPRMTMSKFAKYEGLFAEEGGFDIPSNWQAGLSFDISEDFTIMADVKQIMYSDGASISNPMNPQQIMPMVPNPNMTSPADAMMYNPNFVALGDDNGAGFGWEDMMIVKVGAEFRQVENWQFRLGFSYGKQPIPESEVMFNMIAPAVNESHVSAGFTRKMGEHALNFAITHALENTVSGPNPFDPAQQIELTMAQWEIEIGFEF